MPIKSLLGHRSQAPPEVRHVSGQHIKEFRDFLAKYPDDFVVNDEVRSLNDVHEGLGEGGGLNGYLFLPFWKSFWGFCQFFFFFNVGPP